MDGNKPNVPEQQFISFQDFGRPGGQALLDIDIPIQQSSNNFSSQPTAPPSDNLQQATPDQSTG